MNGNDVVIGTLGAPHTARVNARGTLVLPHDKVEFSWRVGTPEWRDATRDPSVRQSVRSGAPISITRMALGGADIEQRCYGVAGSPPVAVMEFANTSREPVTLALLINASPGGRIKKVIGDTHTLLVNDLEVFTASRPWQQWVVASDELTLRTALDAHATTGGALTAAKMRGQRSACIALVWPLPHAATLRCAVPLGEAGRERIRTLQLDAQPDADAIARGWESQLDRAMRVEISDGAMQAAIDGARAAMLLLSSDDAHKPDADDLAALEDWGFDHEAAASWQRLSVRDRRAAGSRTENTVDGWVRVKTHIAAAPNGVPSAPTRFLRAVRDVVLDDTGDDVIDLMPHFPVEWLGMSVAVHDAPTRRGPVSFALRWHGGRPALLWYAPEGVNLRATRLDPTWSASGGSGEQLLAEPSNDLLALQNVESTGEIIAEPGSFI